MRFIAVALSLVAVTAGPKSAVLGVSGRSNATPSIAAADRFVVVAWGASLPAGSTDVYSAVSRDGGLTFSPPTRVNDIAGDAALGGEQPPHVSLVKRTGRDPQIVVVWTAKSKEGTRLRVARSDNGGRSFGRAEAIEGSIAAGNRGWEATAVDRDGRVIAVWLDHREMAAMNHEHDHGQPAAAKTDGAAHAQLSKLYFARLDAPASAHAVTGGVCYCCKTAIAAGPDGSIYTAWRHVYPGDLRDIAFSLSRDGGHTFSPPARVSEDHWMLDGCPENGPAIAVDRQKAVHVVWPTLVGGATAEAEPALALFHAVTSDGRQFSARQRIATDGVPRHPQVIATADGTLVAAWDEETAAGRRVAIGRSPRFSREVVSGATRAEYPVLAETTDGVIAAWREGAEGSVIRVRVGF